MTTAVAPAMPSIKEMTREQRYALLVALIKSFFDDAGGLAIPISVRDGETLLGQFRPVIRFPDKTSDPHFTPEEMEEIRKRTEEVRTCRAKLITSEEFLHQLL